MPVEVDKKKCVYPDSKDCPFFLTHDFRIKSLEDHNKKDELMWSAINDKVPTKVFWACISAAVALIGILVLIQFSMTQDVSAHSAETAVQIGEMKGDIKYIKSMTEHYMTEKPKDD